MASREFTHKNEPDVPLSREQKETAEENCAALCREIKNGYPVSFRAGLIRALFRQIGSPGIADVLDRNTKMEWKPQSRLHNTRELLQVMIQLADHEPGSAAHGQEVYESINNYHAALITDDEDEGRVRELRAAGKAGDRDRFSRLPGPKGIVERSAIPKFSPADEQKYTYRVRKEWMPEFMYVLATLVQEPIQTIEQEGGTVTPEQKHAWYHLMIEYAGKPLGMRTDWHPELWNSYESLTAFAEKWRSEHPTATKTSRRIASTVIGKVPEMMPALMRPILGEMGQSVIRASLAGSDLPEHLHLAKSAGSWKAMMGIESIVRSVRSFLGQKTTEKDRK